MRTVAQADLDHTRVRVGVVTVSSRQMGTPQPEKEISNGVMSADPAVVLDPVVSAASSSVRAAVPAVAASPSVVTATSR